MSQMKEEAVTKQSKEIISKAAEAEKKEILLTQQQGAIEATQSAILVSITALCYFH